MINKICASQMGGACGRAGLVGRGREERVGSLFKSLGIAGLIVAPAACLAATPASAQGFPGTPAALGARAVTFNAMGRVKYDSNLAGGASTVAGARDLHKGDVIYTPNLQVNLVLPVAGRATFLRGGVGYDFHEYNTILDSERIDLVGGVATGLGPCGGTLSGGYARRQSDQQDLDLVVTKNTQETISGSLQASCPLGRSLAPFFGVQAARTDNSSAQNVANSESISYSAGLSYSNKAIGVVNLFVSYGESSYDEPSTGLPANRNPGFNNLQAGASIARPIGSRLTGSASIALSRVEVDDPQVGDGYTGITGSGALSYQVNRRLNLSVGYDRATNPTLQEGSSYQLSSSLQISAGYQVSSRLRASLGARWSERSYRGELGTASTRITDEDNRSVFGSLATTLGRDIGVTLDARYEDRNTNLTIFNYDAYQASLTVTKTF